VTPLLALGRARLTLAAFAALAAVVVPSAAARPDRTSVALGRRVAVVRVDALPQLAVTQTLVGLNDQVGGGYDPPDVQIAAGPGALVELVNLAGRIWRTGAGGAELVNDFQLSDFFQTGTDELTDPRIVYDTVSGRWFASLADETTRAVLLAVSASADPTGSWHVYSFSAGGACPDQPRLGTSDGLVVLAADMFDNCTGSFATSTGAELWAVDKAALLAGGETATSATYGPNPDYSSLTPVHSMSATSTQYVVSVDSPGSVVVHLLTVQGTPPDVQVQEVATPSMLALPGPVPAFEPQTGRSLPLLQTNDDRILDAVWEGGKLWLTANDSCVPSGDNGARSCGRVAELDTAAGIVDWVRDIGVAGAYVFFPSVRPDASGNAVVVYGESSPTLLPQIAVEARLADGTWTAPTVVARSGAPYLGRRYGDYFGSARDPGQPNLVWVAGEIGPPAPGDRGWETAVASVLVTPAAAQPPVAAVPLPPRVHARAATGRAGRLVRLSYVALGDGTRIRRDVTVRRGTSVVFRKTSPAGAVRAQRVYTVTWRPAKQLRGSFRFCVRTVRTDGTASPFSCATARLR